MLERAKRRVRGEHPAAKQDAALVFLLQGLHDKERRRLRLFLRRGLLAAAQLDLHAAKAVGLAAFQFDLFDARRRLVEQPQHGGMIILHGARGLRGRGEQQENKQKSGNSHG